MIEKKITVCYLQLLIPTHFINYLEFIEAAYLMSFSEEKNTIQQPYNEHHSSSTNSFNGNLEDSKISSKAKP
jgi:hypothetical protein